MSKFSKEGYTFDDVLIIPRYSECLPKEVDTSSYLTKDIKFSMPILSAAMDTVSEGKMAIALANLGGIGVIHKNLTIKAQCEEVMTVKKYVNGYITDPITVLENTTIGEVKQCLEDSKISGLPVVDKLGKLVGIITNRDLKYLTNDSAIVSEYMQKERLIVGYPGISIKEIKEKMAIHKIEKLPIVDEDFKLVGYTTSRDVDNLENYKDANIDELGRLRCAAAIGVTADVLERVENLVNSGVDVLVLDSAHGHSIRVLETVKMVKDTYPEIPLIVGNIATKEAAIALSDLGVEAVKVGIGPGSICTTRIITGVGRPQITAINEVAEALANRETKVIADGGLKYSGDIAKAIVAGADFVMLGSMLAGTDESPGEVFVTDGKMFKSYIGMGSIEAMNRGGKDRYFQGENKGDKLISEGVSGIVGYKGSVVDVLYQLVGGLRSSMGYAGSSTIESLKTANFQVISSTTLAENHPHSIVVTNEQPNYNRM